MSVAQRLRQVITTAAALAAASVTCASPGEIVYSVEFVDPFGDFDASTREQIEDHVVAAGAAWDDVLIGAASIEVRIVATRDVPRATGTSVTSSFVENDGVFNVFEQGMAGEIRTGVDPNGADADVEFEFNPDYLFGELWFDPDPFARVAPVPSTRTDAMTVFLHEFGHAIAYNGWLDGVTGELPGDFRSPWDAWVKPIDDDFFFTGPNVMALTGGPAAVTFGNPAHWGNDPPRAGEELIPELMNGVVFFRGERYDITPLDRATLLDVGLAITPNATGDYNGDGLIEAGDYDVWERSYGAADVTISDGNGDGQIDAADYTVWRDALAATAVAVPEPSGALLLASAACFAGRRFGDFP